jgi:hypothetical protein
VEDDARAAKDVAHRFLLALYRDDVSPYLVDRLDWLALEPGERLGTGSVELDLRKLDVVRLDDRAAAVEAVAHIDQVWDHPVHGSVESSFDFDGVIELERVDGEWRIADYTNEGRRLSDATRPREVLELGKLAISVPVLNLGPLRTYVALAVENRGPHLVVLSELYRGARALGLWRYVPVPFLGAVEIPPRSRIATSAGWRERLPLRTRELRFLLRAGEADGPERFELAFAVRRTRRPQLVSLGRPPLLQRLPVRVRRLVQIAPIALFVLLLLAHQLRAAGVVLLLYGAAFGAALAVLASRLRSVRDLVVPVVATIAFGAWLVWTGGTFG